MGQAFRRASGRFRTSTIDTSPSPSSSSHLKKSIDPRPHTVPIDKVPSDTVSPSSDGDLRDHAGNVLEERDSQYDAMLGKMVGRIKSKPGGKLEMGEAFVVEKYKRPLPKLRNTTPDSGRYEERHVPPGTLNVAQLRHIIHLYQGKADDHSEPMDIHQIAQKFQIDVSQVQRVVQFVSLPPEDKSKQKKDPQ